MFRKKMKYGLKNAILNPRKISCSELFQKNSALFSAETAIVCDELWDKFLETWKNRLRERLEPGTRRVPNSVDRAQICYTKH